MHTPTPTGEQKLPSVALSRLNFEAFVRDLLLVKQYRVEIYQSKFKGASWTVAYKVCGLLWALSLTPSPPAVQATPGNLQQLEDVVFGSSEMETATCVMAVKLGSEGGQRSVGVAYTDACARKLGVSEFVDSDQFSNLQVGRFPVIRLW